MRGQGERPGHKIVLLGILIHLRHATDMVASAVKPLSLDALGNHHVLLCGRRAAAAKKRAHRVRWLVWQLHLLRGCLNCGGAGRKMAVGEKPASKAQPAHSVGFVDTQRAESLARAFETISHVSGGAARACRRRRRGRRCRSPFHRTCAIVPHWPRLGRPPCRPWRRMLWACI